MVRAARGKVHHRPRAALIVFVANLSGLGQATIGNDIPGFSHAVLEAGATAYMGASWMFDDVATMSLTVLFYRNMWERRSEGLAVAELWREATAQFYSLDMKSAKQILKRVGKERGKPRMKESIRIRSCKNMEQERLAAEKRLNINPKHPFCWASFVLVGYGGFMCQANDSRPNEVVEATTRS
jgi:CHAT domain-containing protein